MLEGGLLLIKKKKLSYHFRVRRGTFGKLKKGRLWERGQWSELRGQWGREVGALVLALSTSPPVPVLLGALLGPTWAHGAHGAEGRGGGDSPPRPAPARLLGLPPQSSS